MAVSTDTGQYEDGLAAGVRDGMISGSIVGGLLTLILLILLIMCCVRKKRNKRSKQKEKKLKAEEARHETPTVTVETLPLEERSATESSPETIMRSLNVDVPIPMKRRISGYNNRDHDDLQPIRSKMANDDMEKAMEDYRVEEKRLKLEDVIGRGSFSLVYNGRLYDKSQKDSQLVTVKTVHGTGCTPSILKSFVEQGMLLRDHKHPNILNILGLVIQDDQPFLAFPRTAKGNLRTYLVSPHMHFTAKTLIQMGSQVAEAMQYLARQAFIHKDIATRNCVVHEDGVVKLADSALSQDMFTADYFLVEELSPDPLPIAWMAVETLTQLTYSLHTDVWSFGVLLWELITRGQAPFSDMDGPTIIALVRTGQRLERPFAAPTSLYELMQSCWAEDPSLRPSFNTICETLGSILNGPNRAKVADYKKVIRASNF